MSWTVWYKNNKKRTKQELQEEGTYYTVATILAICLCFVSAFITIFLLYMLPVLILILVFYTIINNHLLKLKKEWYERFCR